jgi:putative SOS response-associated peptidase YedK
MCNLYTQTRAADAMRGMFAPKRWENRAGNLEPGDIYPDRMAPILRIEAGTLLLERARWGLPSPPQYLTSSGLDRGVTNVRNTASPHWRRWLEPAHRCLVPFDRFAEPGPSKKNVWFAPQHGTGFFAGLWVPNWSSIRKVKDGATTDDLFAFLTCAPNAEVAAVHPKAMPVILQTLDDMRQWLAADWPVAQALQRPLPDGALICVDPDSARQ